MAVAVGDPLAEQRLGALAGQLTGVLGQLVPRALQFVVDFVPRRGEDLLRFRFRRGDQLALLALALGFGALADRAQLVLDLREARLDVGRELVGFRATLARFRGCAANLLAPRGKGVLHRSADQPAEETEEDQHVGELEDPAGDAEIGLRRLVAFAVRFARMRDFVRGFFAAVRHIVRVLLREERCDGKQENEEEEQLARHHTALPRIRSAASRASDSDSRTIVSRAAWTSASRCLSASLTIAFASVLVFSIIVWRCAAASPRACSRSCAASRLALWRRASISDVAAVKRASASSCRRSAVFVSVSRASSTSLMGFRKNLRTIR